MRVECIGGQLQHDYTGAHVAWSVGERNYLGTVAGSYLSPLQTVYVLGRRVEVSVRMFRVRHFNGEDAPDVQVSDVEVLEREWEAADAGTPMGSRV